ncbi:MAG: DUF3413 domain-containing protein [Gammaproteobacteria bacterium]|nr:DUF3413 domain-containing protein [Gammaproteobacteria bacterium]MCH9743878.1 DUF3413 domain-containing protein [Gammaproteobacteria bacterium]
MGLTHKKFSLFVYFLLNLTLLYLIGSRYLFAAGFNHDGWGLGFMLSSYFGQLGLIALISALLLPKALSLFSQNPKIIWPILIAINTVLSLYLLVDTFVYHQYSFHMNGIILQMIFSRHMSQVFEMNGLMWLAIIMMCLALLFIQILFLKIASRNKNNTPKKIALPLVSLVVISWGFSQITHAWFNAVEYQPVTQYTNMLPYYYAMSAMGFLKKHHLITMADIKKHRTDSPPSGQNLHYPLHRIYSGQQQAKPLNILFLVIDTWRADIMSPQYSPNIYNFAKQASVFDHHYSGGDCTQPGIFSLFYGIPSTYWDTILAHHRAPVLMDQLQKHHYQFGIYASAPLTTPPFTSTVFANLKNIDITTPGDTPWQRDININKRMLQFLKKNQHSKKPIFGFLFYDAVHADSIPANFHKPFQPAEEMNYLTINNNTNPTKAFNHYKDAVYFDDALVAKILKALKTEGYLKNTVVIITADHGQEFNEEHKDHWGHASDFSKYQMQTPMIVYWPGKSAKHYHYFTSHYDVTPTLLQDILQVKNRTEDYSSGQNLFNPHNRSLFLVVSSYQYQGIITPKLIITYHKNGYYTVTDHQLNIPRHGNTVPSASLLARAFKLMTQYR